MNEFSAKAFEYLKRHWETGVTGTSDATSIIGMNSNTLKTRISRGLALVTREGGEGEGERGTLSFSGYQLVYNLIADRLLRYGFSLDGHPEDGQTIPALYANWVFDNVLSPPHYRNAVLRSVRDVNGVAVHKIYEEGDVLNWTGDSALVTPIGTLVERMAISVYARSGRDEMINEMYAHIAPLSEGLDD